MRKFKRAAFFDLDKTILATSTTMAMHGPLRKAALLTRADAVSSTLRHLPYLVIGEGEERNNRMKEELGRISNGWSLASLRKVANKASITQMYPRCFEEALDEIAYHQAAGHAVVIASASPAPLVEPLARLLGADFVLATQIEVVDGKLTGQVKEYNHGTEKAAAARQLAAAQGWDLKDCWAYSDSISDLPLFESVGHPIPVNPDRPLRQIATERDWQVHRYSRTVKVLPKQVIPPVVAGTLTTSALAALAGYLLWSAGKQAGLRAAQAQQNPLLKIRTLW
ncbi:HAD hydrolase, family IB [Gleimia coleocanis DSM 15436]|uniref:HAD hydrolase, family IB n=1 Tax=Gleimia coleocanis DSM 15436 TaxID=525245 RepID=C0VYN0_9ACTO|nr:HAD family hydrolase [Gleimia coleocanis]EEH64533.1 HAD hydrolase, family IB [Gleimia coleocanis DSM 15436]